jgi:hypothetical protein
MSTLVLATKVWGGQGTTQRLTSHGEDIRKYDATPVHEYDTDDSPLVFLLVQASGVRSNVQGSAIREHEQALDFLP